MRWDLRLIGCMQSPGKYAFYRDKRIVRRLLRLVRAKAVRFWPTTGLYLLRTSGSAGDSEREILAHVETCCAEIGAMLRDRLNQTYNCYKTSVEEEL